jgi:hypothetical protein
MLVRCGVGTLSFTSHLVCVVAVRKAKLRDALGQQENTVRGIYLPILCKHSCQTMQCPRNLSKRPVLLCYRCARVCL